MPWTINAEIYPLWARGAGNGASTFCNWLFNLCSSVTFLSLTESIGAHGKCTGGNGKSTTGANGKSFTGANCKSFIGVKVSHL